MGYLLKYMKKYRVQAVIGPCFKIVESLLELCTPLVMASIIDKGIVAKDLSYVLNKGFVMVGVYLGMHVQMYANILHLLFLKHQVHKFV